MCIYLGNKEELTYETREHVFPAGLGGCEKLEKGMVSDQANTFFSKIERNVLEKSLLQLNRIFDGPGKRGSLSDKKATTSDVIVMDHAGRECLGYMKGSNGYILEQLIISDSSIQFEGGTEKEGDLFDKAKHLIDKLKSMGKKYVPIELPEGNKNIIVTFFKEKIYIASSHELSDEDILSLKQKFDGSVNFGKSKIIEGGMSGKLEIEENIVNVKKMVAKIAINTLAYTYGQESAEKEDLNEIKAAIFSEDDKIERYVCDLQADSQLKKKMGLLPYQHACIILQERESMRAIIFIYERAWQVDLGVKCKKRAEIIDGIVCDWKNRKDYKYFDYFLSEGIRLMEN